MENEKPADKMAKITRRDLIVGGIVTILAVPFVNHVSLRLFEDFKKRRLRESIKTVLENRVYLETDFKYTREGEKDIRTTNKKQLTGHGIIVEDYVFTMNHLINKLRDIEKTEWFFPPFGNVIIYNINKVSSETKIKTSKLELIASNADIDYAILKLPENYQKPENKVKIGDASKLKPLDKVYLIGDPSDKYIIIRQGIVSNEIERRNVGDGISYGFNISIPSYYGDSGSACLNEDGELVGFLNQKIQYYSSNIVPIDIYLRELKGKTEIYPM